MAISDEDGAIASPLSVIQRQGDAEAQARAVIAAGEDYDAAAYVLGLPLNMDGTVGDQAKLTQRFGKLLVLLSGKAVHEWDERLSSLGADAMLLTAT